MYSYEIIVKDHPCTFNDLCRFVERADSIGIGYSVPEVLRYTISICDRENRHANDLILFYRDDAESDLLETYKKLQDLIEPESWSKWKERMYMDKKSARVISETVEFLKEYQRELLEKANDLHMEMIDDPADWECDFERLETLYEKADRAKSLYESLEKLD